MALGYSLCHRNERVIAIQSNKGTLPLIKLYEETHIMPALNDIRDITVQVTAAKSAIADQYADYQKAAELKQFRGRIADACKSVNADIRSRVITLQNTCSALKSRLDNLSNAVQMVENKERLRSGNIKF